MTTATATPIAIQKILRQACRVFYNVGLPASSLPPSRLILHSDGSPDALTSPNALYMGSTEKGATLNYSYELEREYIDEMSAPFRTAPKNEQGSIEIAMMEFLDLTRLSKIIPTGTLGTVSSPAGKIISAGGILTIAPAPIAVITERPDSAGKFFYFLLYAGINAAPVQIQLSANVTTKLPVRFEGMGLATRTRGDQLCQWLLEDAA